MLDASGMRDLPPPGHIIYLNVHRLADDAPDEPPELNRLRELAMLHDEGYLTDDEFHQKRMHVVDQLVGIPTESVEIEPFRARLMRRSKWEGGIRWPEHSLVAVGTIIILGLVIFSVVCWLSH